MPRTIDAVPMLPYLTNPGQKRIRKWNFTQVGANLQANGTLNAPCTIAALHADSGHQERLRGQQRHLVGRGCDDPDQASRRVASSIAAA